MTDALPGMREIAPPAGKKPRAAKSWPEAELAAADAVIAEWNRAFDRVEGGYRAHLNYHNRHQVILFFRDQQQLHEDDRFTVDEVRRAIQAYRDDSVNKKLDGGSGRWRRFSDWFDRRTIAETIDHQLRRIGYNRSRGPAGNPDVQQSKPPTPEQARARNFLDGTGWTSSAWSAAQSGLSLRAWLQRQLDNNPNTFGPQLHAAFEDTRARWQRQIDTIDRFEAMPAADREAILNRARRGFELYFDRAPRDDSTADQTRLQAIAAATLDMPPPVSR